MYLWRPTLNNQRYAYSALEGGEDDEDYDVSCGIERVYFSFSCVCESERDTLFVCGSVFVWLLRECMSGLCLCMCVRVCSCLCGWVRVCDCVFVCLPVSVRMCRCACVRLCVCACISAYLYVLMKVCICVYVFASVS